MKEKSIGLKNIREFNIKNLYDSEFIQFIKINKFKFMVAASVLFLVYGRFLWHSSLMPDNNFFVNDSHTWINWLDIRRQGGGIY